MKVKGYVNSLTTGISGHRWPSQQEPSVVEAGDILESSYEALRNQMRIGSTWIHRIWILNSQDSIQYYCWWFRNPAFTSWGNGRLSHYLQGFMHPRWCRISSINSIIGYQDEAVQGSKHMSLYNFQNINASENQETWEDFAAKPILEQRERDAFFLLRFFLPNRTPN